MTSDNNDHLHDHNNHYSNDNMHDEFLNGNDNHNEELINKTGDINDIDQYIQNIPVSADQSDKHIIGNVIRPSMNIFGNLHQTPVQTLNTTGTTTNSNNMNDLIFNKVIKSIIIINNNDSLSKDIFRV